MAAPKVSVIVPVYNTEKYLKQCVDSLTAQTLTDIEIILVDDGSREECAALCDELAAADARVRVIHKTNAGAGLARNAGLAEASGEYIGFLDSDDYFLPEMYEVLYAAAIQQDADLVLCGTCFVDGNTFSHTGDHTVREFFDKETIFEGEDMKTLLLGVVGALPEEAEDCRYGVSVCKNLFRRSLFTDKHIEFLSERQVMSEDAIFMVDFIQCARKAVGLPGAYYCYRRNDESISKSYRSDRFDKMLIFRAEMEAHIRDTLSPEEYGLYLDRLTQAYGRILCSQEILHARAENSTYAALRSRLKRICTNETMEAVLKSYPWYRLPKKQAIFAGAMKYKLYFLQKLLVLLRAR